MIGLLTHLLTAPLAPVHGVLWLTRLLGDLAASELDDPEVLRGRLREAEEAHRRGEISAEELGQVEDAVVTRLVAIQQGGGVT